MRPLSSAALLAVLFVAVAQSPFASAQESSNLDFCPRPVKPACVDDNDTYTKPAAQRACDEEMARFVKATFTYRGCISIQMENVIRDTNRLAERFRCKAEGKRNCN